VDDETPDNSMQIVQEFVDKYPDMIQVIHQKNTRQGGARNRGVQEAKGEYILFVDSDDYVHPDMLKTIDTHLKETPCDILVFRFITVTEDGQQLGISDLTGMAPGIYEPDKDSFMTGLLWSPVDKAYRREFYIDSGVQFPEKLLYEDGVIRLLLPKASRILVCDVALYFYVQSKTSTMRQGLTQKMLDIIPITNMVLQQAIQDGFYEKHHDVMEWSLIRGVLSILFSVIRIDRRNDMAVTLADYIRDTFVDWSNNPIIDDEGKKRLKLAMAHRFSHLYFRLYILCNIKAVLLKFPPVACLNKIRKKLRGK
jgi:glycosyltransferase involved in cell wall biosynthesis